MWYLLSQRYVDTDWMNRHKEKNTKEYRNNVEYWRNTNEIGNSWPFKLRSRGDTWRSLSSQFYDSAFLLKKLEHVLIYQLWRTRLQNPLILTIAGFTCCVSVLWALTMFKTEPCKRHFIHIDWPVEWTLKTKQIAQMPIFCLCFFLKTINNAVNNRIKGMLQS